MAVPAGDNGVTPQKYAVFRLCLAAEIQGTARGAQGVILGCTEIGLLVRPQDTPVRLFDTTEIHARRAALYALGDAPQDKGE